ncbi:MAG: murein biosynthesis integral membrane protein MurJ [Chthonomonas sp.]|nr:murein biosynthesis integral membrane protein MurJ [Chthonomonas sp.]
MADAATPKSAPVINVARAGGIMMASLFLSRVLGIVREMIINWKFGQSAMTDAYRTAFQVPDFLFYLLSAGALSQAFIPVFSEYFHTDRPRDAWAVFSSVATICGTFILGFIVVCWVAAVPVAHYLAPNASPDQVQLIARMSRILVPTQFAFIVGGLLMGTLYARQVFSIPGLGPNIYNLGIIFGATLLSQLLVIPVAGMTWGALVGAYLGSLIIPLIVIRRMGMEFRPNFSLQHPGVRKVFRLMAPIIFGLSLPSVFPVITRYFGNYYATGTISALENMNQLMQAPLGIFGQSLAIAVLPALSQFFAEGNMDKYRDQLVSTVRTCIFLAAPFVAMFLVFSEPIVRMLFEHGRFTAADTARTAPAVAMAGIGIIGWCLQPVMMRGFFAVQRTLPPVLLGSTCTILYATTCYCAVRYQWPPLALPLAGSICAILMSLAMIILIQKYVGALKLRPVAITLGKSLIASAIGGAFLFAVKSVMPAASSSGGRIGNALLTLFILICFGWVYYFAAKFLAMPETDYLSRALNRRNKAATPPAE